VAVVEIRGTLFPGLIELHNHPSYNALPLWSPVPKRFTNRGQWGPPTRLPQAHQRAHDSGRGVSRCC
jgi:hypothetical protein